jgi:hypothetical protein
MSLETPEIARLRQAFVLDDGCLGECPAPETIWTGAHGELGHHELRALLDHVSACTACAEDWRLAAELGKGASSTAFREERRVAASTFQRIRPWAAALAAALVLAVAGIQLARMGDKEETVYREGGAEEIRSLVPEGQTLPRDRFLLSWESVPEASSYEVVVSTRDLRELVTERVAEPRLLVREDALSGLAPGATLHWQVRAVFPDGSARDSATFTVSVR